MARGEELPHGIRVATRVLKYSVRPTIQSAFHRGHPARTSWLVSGVRFLVVSNSLRAVGEICQHDAYASVRRLDVAYDLSPFSQVLPQHAGFGSESMVFGQQSD